MISAFLSRNDNAGFFYEIWQRRQGLERVRDTNGWVDVLGEFSGDGKVIGAFVIACQGATFNKKVSAFADISYRPEQWDDRNACTGIFKLDDRWHTGFGFYTARDKWLSVGANVNLWQEHFEGRQVSR